MARNSWREKGSLDPHKSKKKSKCPGCLYPQTLHDRIFLYRNMRRNTFLFMATTIVFLLFLNYFNLENTRCSNFNIDLLSDDYETNIQIHNNTTSDPTTPIPSVTSTLPPSLLTTQPSGPAKSSFKIPDFFNNILHLKAKGRVMQPRFLESQHQKDKFLTIGVPTVKRKSMSYLKPMLASLFESLASETEEVRAKVMVVVMIAERDDLKYIEYTIAELKSNFQDELDSGRLEVIVPEKDYYPDFTHLTDRIFGDIPNRVKWRRKQNYDISYLMSYCNGKGRYYLQLEDDVATSPNLVTIIKTYIGQFEDGWFMVEFCDLGFIGKLYHDRDLALLINYFLMFSDLMPVDILAMVIQQTLICDPAKNSKACHESQKVIVKRYMKSLFQHIGTQSSLDGKVQKLKSTHFEEKTEVLSHANPPANVSTSLQAYADYSLINCYNGKSIFWGMKENANELNDTYISFKFTPPVVLSSMRIKSGNIFHLTDVFPSNGSVLVLAATKEGRKRNRGYVRVHEVNGEEIRVEIDYRMFDRVEEVRLEFSSKFDNWILIRDIEFVVYKKGQNEVVGV